MRSRTLLLASVWLALPFVAVGQNKTSPLGSPKQAPASVPAHVFIAGAVAHPGAFTLTAHTRLQDVLKLAAPTQDANLSQVHMTEHRTGLHTRTSVHILDARPLLLSAKPCDQQNPLLRPDVLVFVPFKVAPSH